jgi:cytochrome P450
MKTMQRTRHIPGPAGHPLFGSLPELRVDALGYLRECARRYGSIVRLRMPWPLGEMILVTDVALAEQIFLDDADSFRNSRMTQRMAAPILGNGLLLAEGAAWRRQRRMLQPAFARKQIASYVDDIARCSGAMSEGWEDGAQRDVYVDALACSIQIAARTLFGASLGSEAERAQRALEGAMTAFDRFKHSRLPLPLSIPTPNGLRLRRAARNLERVVYALIAQRRSSELVRDDLLATLLQARDDDGQPLSDRQIRDEAITAFAAGTETVAIALAWSFYLLACHPEVGRRIRAEAREVAGSAALEAQHLPRLRYTDRVVRESLRMFPPVWRTSRETARDYTLHGFRIKEGAQVVVSQYLNQHDPRYFAEPERFDPERWSDDFMQSLPKFAYFPFGAGQRMCIGHSFAMTELVVGLATVARRVDFTLAGAAPKPRAGSMLRAQDGVQLRVAKLDEQPNAQPHSHRMQP